MKVKIIKSKLPTMWYANKIGETFEVNKYVDSKGMYKVKQKNIYVPAFIYAEDVIKIETRFSDFLDFDDYPNEGRTRYLNTRFDDYPYNGD